MARRRPAATALAALLLGGALALPTLAVPAPSLASTVTGDYGFQGEGPGRLGDVDRRTGSLAPTAQQEQAADALGASVRWNPLGTPATVSRVDGHLSAARAGAAKDVARAFLREQTALLGVSTAQVDALELLGDTPLYDAPDLARVRDGQAPQNPDVAHVVLFRQTFAGLPAAQDGLVVVGVTKAGEVTYLSSSLARAAEVTGARSLSAAQAYVAAAADVQRSVGLADVAVVTEKDANGFSTFRVPGTDDLQYARLRALPTPQDGVRPVWETVVLDNQGGETGGDAEHPAAFISFVDAESGRVLFRTNRVDHLAAGARTQAALPTGGPFTGATNADGSATPDAHPFAVGEGVRSLTVAANGLPNTSGNSGDVVLSIDRVTADGARETVASQDLVTAEALNYAPTGGVAPGTYYAVVSAFETDAGAVTYSGAFSANTGALPSVNASPRWEVFPANPQIADPANGDAPATAAPRETWCWEAGEGCDRVVGNAGSRAPWDVDTRTGASTFTTTGNNARTAPSFASFTSPDAGAALQPYSLSRDYDFAFTNQWYERACDPAVFATPEKNDLDAASTNLFVGHNRIHDWTYFLGFTEETWNLQANNLGNRTEGQVPTGGEHDPELGQTQAGAIGGGPAFLGRDNANQITLQDGIPGITNQYLWQPLQAGFYAPCVDGAYDASVIAHEYGHAVQNRMVAGPDAGLSGHQSRAMGESWADLTAVEYLNSYGLAGKSGEDRFAVGAFVTGDKDKGIRNYNMSRSPLNFSNLGYDGSGATSPHADGEIWSATNYTLRQALAKKHDLAFPSTDAALQARCSDGVLPADRCPGNRRWAQIMHDAFLLQLAATDMTTARDAYLAADRLRFGGANQAELWTAFAQRGLGAAASSDGPEDLQARPSFAVPAGVAGNSTVTFTPTAADGGAAPTGVTVHVGRIEARSVPAATGTVPTATLVAGSYEFVASAPGFATTRFSATVVPGTTAVAVPMRRNLAAGGTVAGGGVQQDKLVDGTEATNLAQLGGTVQGSTWTVELGGTPTAVTEVQVSAALRPTDGAATGDTGGQSRFSAVRSFEVLTCSTGCTDPAAFTSAGVFRDAFPADRPRPTVPDLGLRSFDIADTTATHVAIRVLDNQCTGGPLYTGAANPDSDPVNDPDCVNGRTAAGATAGTTSLSQARNVRIAELQVLGPVAAVVTDPVKKPRPVK